MSEKRKRTSKDRHTCTPQLRKSKRLERRKPITGKSLFLDVLPCEIITKVLSYLDWESILEISCTCKYLRELVRKHALHLYKVKRVRPLFCTNSHHLLRFAMKTFAQTLQHSCLPVHIRSLKINFEKQGSLSNCRLPERLGLVSMYNFHGDGIKLDLNGVENFELRYSSPSRYSPTFYTGQRVKAAIRARFLGCGNTKTLLLEKCRVFNDTLNSFKSLETAVFLGVQFTSECLLPAIKNALFFKCVFFNNRFKAMDKACIIGCTIHLGFYRSAEKGAELETKCLSKMFPNTKNSKIFRSELDETNKPQQVCEVHELHGETGVPVETIEKYTWLNKYTEEYTRHLPTNLTFQFCNAPFRSSNM
jgi:F-box associated protein